MNVKPKFVYYDIRRKQSVCLIMYTHENDVDTQVLEVSMLDNGEPIELDADYIYSAAIVNRDTKALINDNISCELNNSGNVLIPIDNFHTLGAQDLLIELTITDGDGNQVLVTPFPLWIHVNASILDDAQITPESQGTVPELLEEAKEALENAGDYENLENKPQINGHELVGDKSSDDLGLQKKLTAGTNITITNDGTISASGGVTSYSDLTDKPQINGITLSGNKKNSDLGFSNFYYSESNPPIYTSSAVDYQLNDIWINTNTNTAFRLGYKDKDNLLWYPLRVKVFLSSEGPPQFERVHINSLIYNAGDIWIHRTLYNPGKPQPFYVLDELYICVGSAKQSQFPLDQYNITWARLDNKVQSGVVNSNGSITFTNSDGTTFTTSGTSVIGADGFSPTATVTQTQNGATVSITDKNGTTTANISNGADGNDYVLTAQDKSDIANIVLSELPTTQGVQYGNSND